MDNAIKNYISIVPSTGQKIIQRQNFNVFFHYGLNTFTGKEWGDGKVSPSLFNPSSQDTDQWVRTAKEAGAYGVILTCKHHDGFCLWQTKTTDYSVASSPYKGGKGDVVKEVSESCKKYGMKFGVYLSPWDRNHKAYSTDEYNDVYCEQLRELLTGYGEVFCVWLDGACGSYMDGKPKQKYDWDRFFALIRELAPNAVISNCGPDVRWVGNEGGFARESEWNVVPKFSYDIQTIEDNSQKADDGEFAKKGADIVFSDLGSREFLSAYDNFIWYPAEVDVSVRPGWFYHKTQDTLVRSLENVLNIYYNSVGGNSILLLNFPPDMRGLIADNDVRLARALGEHIRKDESLSLPISDCEGPEAQGENVLSNVYAYEYDKNTGDPLCYYTPAKESDSYTLSFKLGKQQKINRVRIVENTAFSQRIEKFQIFAYVNGKRKKIFDGTTVGYNRICITKPVLTDKIEIVISQSRSKPYIEYVGIYEDNGYRRKKQWFIKFKRWIHETNYKVYINRENKNRKSAAAGEKGEKA